MTDIEEIEEKYRPWLVLDRDEIGRYLTWTDHAIIGLSTNNIREIVEDVRKHHIRLLIKDNILPCLIDRMEKK